MQEYLQTLVQSQLSILNTLRKVGVDDNTAYQYLSKNGVVNGKLDYSLSGDFIETGGVGAYDFTGSNLKESFKAADYNYNIKFTKPKVDGDVFAQPDSLLKPQGMDKPNAFKKAALSTALTGQNEEGTGVQFASLKATDPNSNISGTGSTSGAYTKEGSLLTKAQLAFFQGQNLDIA
jgi:hypothetical protein